VVDHCKYAEPALKTIEGTLHPLVYGWIDAGVAVLTGQDPLRHSLQPLRGWTFAEQEEDWEGLAERVGGLIGRERRSDVRDALLREWIWRLAYFLMPSVSGVAKGVTKVFGKQAEQVEQAKLVDLWRSGQGVINRYLQEIFTFLADKRMNDLAAKLKGGVEEYARELNLSLGRDIGPGPDAHP
jgi:hypothetical protein